MGLAGPQNRRKIGRDPNNTQWSRDTERFGHRVLTGLGWQPGKTLGKRNAEQAPHYTAASISHIRAILKDDQLGLGAKRGKADAEFGLDVFSSVLGRLNGKSEGELQEEESRTRDVKVARYAATKLGAMNFISGGFLVGDKYQRVVEKEVRTGVDPVQGTVPSNSIPEGKSLKRKRGQGTQLNEDPSLRKHQKWKREIRKDTASKKDREVRDGRAIPINASSMPAQDENKDSRQTSAFRTLEDAVDGTADGKRKSADKKRTKHSKRSREKEDRNGTQNGEALPPTLNSIDSKISISTPFSIGTVQTPSAAESPAPSGTSTPRGRHVIRSRYIQQKRLATLDAKALNEIFMIKTPV